MAGLLGSAVLQEAAKRVVKGGITQGERRQTELQKAVFRKWLVYALARRWRCPLPCLTAVRTAKGGMLCGVTAITDFSCLNTHFSFKILFLCIKILPLQKLKTLKIKRSF